MKHNRRKIVLSIQVLLIYLENLRRILNRKMIWLKIWSSQVKSNQAHYQRLSRVLSYLDN